MNAKSSYIFSKQKVSDQIARTSLLNNIKLCYNPVHDCWSVFTVKLPSNTMTWLLISDYHKDWYVENFNPPIVDYCEDCAVKEVPEV